MPGVAVLDISLFDLSLSILEERGILEQVLEVEPETDKGELRELLQSVLDPQANLIPKIGEAIERRRTTSFSCQASARCTLTSARITS